MCGLAGFISNKISNEFKNDLKRSTKSLKHRGPESRAVWFSNNIGLGHTRLSILDLNKSASQPMVSMDNRFIIAYNGEIYNFKEIVTQLPYRVNESSDTRVILETISHFGLEKSLTLFNGMFAFALWDNKKQELYLVRDSIGVKPLYYAIVPNGIIFGSEIKALKNFSSFSRTISEEGALEFFTNQYIPSPLTIYKNCHKVKPGEIIIINKKLNLISKRYSPKTNNYSNINSYKAAENKFEEILTNSLKQNFRSDVPIASFLSGGLDSSLIVAILSSQKNFKTFSVGYMEKKYDESSYAEKISNYLNLQHEKLIIQPQDIQIALDSIGSIYDEPFGDSSCIPVFLLSSKIAKEFKVAISGDGADELFGGYPRYFISTNLWKKIDWIPQKIRKFLSFLIDSKNNSLLKILSKPFLRNPETSLIYLKKSLQLQTLYQFFLKNNYLGQDENGLENKNGIINKSILIDYTRKTSERIKDLLLFDQTFRLPDNMLTKVDRASMANSLEVRVPFLDNEIVAFSRQIKERFLVNEHSTKPLLRNLITKKIPKKLLTPQKTGFHVPIKLWLREHFKNWSENILYSVEKDDIINMKYVKNQWKNYILGEDKNFYQIWNVIVYLQWKKKIK